MYQPFHQSTFTYCFKYPLEIVYDCFCYINIVPKKMKTNTVYSIVMEKGSHLGQEGARFTIYHEDQFEMNMQVTNSIIKPNYRSFTHNLINNHLVLNKKRPPDFIGILSFYYNTCENETFFKCQRFLRTKLCSILYEKYVIIKNLDVLCKTVDDIILRNQLFKDQTETILIKEPIIHVWKYIVNIEHLFNSSIDYALTHTDIHMKGIVQVKEYTLMNKSEKIGVIHIVYDNNNNRRMKLTLDNIGEDCKIPQQKITFNLISLDSSTCYVSFNHVVYQSVLFNQIKSVINHKKVMLCKLKEHFESDCFNVINSIFDHKDLYDDHNDVDLSKYLPSFLC